MLHLPKTSASNKSDAFSKFAKAVKQIISVPKEELEEREASYRKERAAKRAARHAKLKTLVILALCCLSFQSVRADPEERAQMMKARMMERLISDGWQLVNETHSLLILEKPLTGWGAPVVQALTTGANGTHPTYRLSITVVPQSDHYTQIPSYLSLNSQNAFGQNTSISIRNKKIADYINAVMTWAAEGLPEKYKHEDRH